MNTKNYTCREALADKPIRNPMPLKIGVMGGATGKFQRHHMDKAHRIGGRSGTLGELALVR